MCHSKLPPLRILNTKNKARDITVSDFKTYYKVGSLKIDTQTTRTEHET